eukprot:scaffold126494_cov30-Tisochrysis_lutea.AAC.2
MVSTSARSALNPSAPSTMRHSKREMESFTSVSPFFRASRILSRSATRRRSSSSACGLSVFALGEAICHWLRAHERDATSESDCV